MTRFQVDLFHRLRNAQSIVAQLIDLHHAHVAFPLTRCRSWPGPGVALKYEPFEMPVKRIKPRIKPEWEGC